MIFLYYYNMFIFNSSVVVTPKHLSHIYTFTAIAGPLCYSMLHRGSELLLGQEDSVPPVAVWLKWKTRSTVWLANLFECLLGASLKPNGVLTSLRHAKHLSLVRKECPCLYLESLCLMPPLLTEDFSQRPSGGGRDSAQELLSRCTCSHTYTYSSSHTNTHII